MTSREAFKRAQYRRADERAGEAGLSHVCVLCHLGVPGGSHIGSDHHEIIPKSRLPGNKNLRMLFSLQNIARACPPHHAQFQHLPLPWMKSMTATGLAQPEQYRIDPFRVYWNEQDYPPTMTCLGRHGYGSRYFQNDEAIPESLARLYEIAIPGFDPSHFCDFCRQDAHCQTVTLEHADVARSASPKQ